MLAKGLTAETLAEQATASTKSVRRWLDGTALPYPKTRYRVAALLQEDESWLWPEAVDAASLAGAELISSWPRRTDVPPRLWTDLLRDTRRSMDLLAFAGLFLVESHPEWIPLLQARAADGVRIRLLIGDPHGTQLASRDREARIGGAVAGRVAAVLTAYEPLTTLVEIRLHDTPLYNSIYRFDDNLLINTHVYGILAAYTPVLHLRRVDGAYVNTYLESFDQAWASARPHTPGWRPANPCLRFLRQHVWNDPVHDNLHGHPSAPSPPDGPHRRRTSPNRSRPAGPWTPGSGRTW